MGGDTSTATGNCNSICFNPRPRMGGDDEPEGIPDYLQVSIHAPAWGATCCRITLPRLPSFNPRPRMGGDKYQIRCLPNLGSFNPRPRMGGDKRNLLTLMFLASFNPRPRMGGDNYYTE